ncbi:MAG: RNA methyltransferase PUA domain-containing protein [Aliarcobacter sp.]
MQFTYDEFCGENILEIKDDVYNYLIKARRHKIDDEIYFRNLKDENLYLYKIILIDKKRQF